MWGSLLTRSPENIDVSLSVSATAWKSADVSSVQKARSSTRSRSTGRPMTCSMRAPSRLRCCARAVAAAPLTADMPCAYDVCASHAFEKPMSGIEPTRSTAIEGHPDGSCSLSDGRRSRQSEIMPCACSVVRIACCSSLLLTLTPTLPSNIHVPSSRSTWMARRRSSSNS